MLESNFLLGYNFGFLNTNSEVIISLLHWQYWWWFWFSFLVSLYYVLIVKYVFARSIKVNPKIVTSFRSHGKWGDVIIGVLPVTWCINILSNSTTLLKLIEWQSEASLFTIRVRGKQWYWVYKIDLKDFVNFDSSDVIYNNINGGRFNDMNTESNVLKDKNTSYDKKVVNKKKNSYNLKKNDDFKDNTPKKNTANENTGMFWRAPIVRLFIRTLKHMIGVAEQKPVEHKPIKISSAVKKILNEFDKNKSRIEMESRYNYLGYRRHLDRSLFGMYNQSGIRRVYTMIELPSPVKKYTYTKYDILTQKSIDGWSKDKDRVSDNSSVIRDMNSYVSYNNMRLLRVNRSLVIPSELFLNIITNSFDVVHSWFVPGLGFKMDCVPGRSTHHTLFVDLPGIYYGQCAEICGRLHHHMPIRVCAMNYEHFMMWYYTVTPMTSFSKNVRYNNLRNF